MNPSIVASPCFCFDSDCDLQCKRVIVGQENLPRDIFMLFVEHFHPGNQSRFICCTYVF